MKTLCTTLQNKDKQVNKTKKMVIFMKCTKILSVSKFTYKNVSKDQRFSNF